MVVNLFGYVLDMLKAIWQFILFALERWYVSVPILIGIILLPFILRIVRAVISRMIFSAKLKSVIKKRGGICRFLRIAIASLFVNDNKDDAELVLNGNTYTIKIFPKNVRTRNVYLHSLEKAFLSRSFAQNLSGQGRFDGKSIINSGEGSKRAFSLEIKPNTQSKYILLFEATPLNVYALDKNGYKTVGSGEEYEGVTLYVGNEFLKYLDR